MSIVAVGLNHRSAPLPLLERVSVPADDLGKALAGLVLRDNISEAVVVSTCMRTEVYVVAERFHGAVSDVIDWLWARSGVGPDELAAHLCTFHDEACATHLFRVAAGLDSAVLGEGEVLGQVRDAWERAMVEGVAGPTLNVLFRHATEVGKRARTETSIARGITSVPQAGVALAASAFPSSSPGPTGGVNVLVVGAGAIGSVVASTVATSWVPSRLVVASRAVESAEALCDRLSDEGYPGAIPAGLDRLGEHLPAADVVFCATASPEPVISAQSMGEAVVSRRAPLVAVDLAVPRDVEPAVVELAGVVLFDMDSIATFVEGEMSGRAAEVVRVSEIIEEELARYLDVASAREVAPLVTALRDQAEEIRFAQLARFRRRLAGLDDAQRGAVESLTRSIVASFLHSPTVRLKSAAGTPRGERLSESLRDLFDL